MEGVTMGSGIGLQLTRHDPYAKKSRRVIERPAAECLAVSRFAEIARSILARVFSGLLLRREYGTLLTAYWKR